MVFQYVDRIERRMGFPYRRKDFAGSKQYILPAHVPRCHHAVEVAKVIFRQLDPFENEFFCRILVEELKARYQMVDVKPVAIVCTIGTNIAKPGILVKAAFGFEICDKALRLAFPCSLTSSS